MPPRLVQNDESWLAFTDLVFVDPVGTGFSRIIENDEKKDGDRRTDDGQKTGDEPDPKEYFGYKRDLESLSEFIGRWLSSNGRWGSPVFIAGESYGGYRVGPPRPHPPGDGRDRAERRDPHLAGARDLDAGRRGDYDVLAWVDRPADDGRRGRAPRPLARLRPRDAARGRAARGRGFRDERLHGVPDARRRDGGRGARPRPDAARGSHRPSRRLGHPRRGAYPDRVFARELLRDERKVLGLYDATITVTDPFPDRESFGGPDPTLSGIGPAYTTAINRQLRSEIGVETDREYTLLSYEVNQEWKDDDKRHFFVPPEGATDDFRYGMSLNPHLKAFITHGRFDLVTPYYASDRLRNLMRLDPAMAGRLTVRHFGGGHMFYAWQESRRAFAAAIAEFVADATAR